MNDQATTERQRGRTVPPLPSFTFPDSGYTVQLRPFSPFIRDDIARQLRKERPAPTPPMVPGVEGALEENDADPDYITETRRYSEWLGRTVAERITKLMVRRVEHELTDDDRAAVAVYRADMDAIDVDVTDIDDKTIFFQQVLVTSDKDISTFQAFLMNRSMPTEEAVKSHIDTFRGNVQG